MEYAIPITILALIVSGAVMFFIRQSKTKH